MSEVLRCQRCYDSGETQASVRVHVESRATHTESRLLTCKPLLHDVVVGADVHAAPLRAVLEHTQEGELGTDGLTAPRGGANEDTEDDGEGGVYTV